MGGLLHADPQRVVEDEDSKRMKRKFVEVGTWVLE
jgi:hypothetical protein